MKKIGGGDGAISKQSIATTMEEANRNLTAIQNILVEKLNSALERKNISFTRDFLIAICRATGWNFKRALKIATKYQKFYKSEVKGISSFLLISIRFDLILFLFFWFGYSLKAILQAEKLLIDDVEKMVLDGVLLVHPMLLTCSGMPVMFMRPARFFPSKMLTSDVIKLLAYMTQRLTEDVKSIDGFTFVADLRDWTMQNFSQVKSFLSLNSFSSSPFGFEIVCVSMFL